MLKVRKDNVILRINDEQKQEYIGMGYREIDEKGNMIGEPIVKIDEKLVKKLKAEVETLKAVIETLKADNKALVEAAIKPEEIKK